MKSIFKKIAFVLALAMVVTAFPAQTAGAAAKGPQLKAHRVLYLGGDATETYGEKAYATVWNFKEDGYTVKFESRDPEIATVGAGKGMVTAVSVGTTIVTATFSKKGERDIVKECKVEVKKNAAAVSLDEASEKALAELTVGSTVTLKAVAADGDGGNDATDFIKFKSDDENVVTVDKKTGELKAVAAGKANVTVYTHQYEYDFEAKKYASKTTAEKVYAVEVAKTQLTAQQTAWNAITITFGTEEDAKTALEASKPALNTADAAVTEKEEIIKIYEVLKNSNNSEKTVYFSGLAQSGNKVIVTLFDEMSEETDYIVRYQDQVINLSTGKYIADDMDIYVVKNESLGTDSSKTILDYHLYTTGKMGQKVDITWAKKYAGWQSGVILEDLNTEAYHAEYLFDATAKEIWFYTADVKYAVNLKAVFEDWYTAVEGKARKIPASLSVHPGDMSTVIGQIIGWGIMDLTGHIENNDKAFDKKAFAAEDNGKKLAVQISLKEAGQDVKKNSCEAAEPFTFVSSNDDKLIVDENTGALYPGKEAINGKVYVHVYYDGNYVGSCDVTIYAKRIFSGFTAEISGSKLHYNSEAPMGVDEELTITLKPVDQLGDQFTSNMTFDAELMNKATAERFVTLTGSSITWKVKAAAGSSLTSAISSFRVVCTAEYDDYQSPKITKKYSVSFTAKDTNGQTPKDYQIVASYPEWWNSGKVDMNLGTVANKTVSLEAYSYDKDGFKIQKLNLKAGHSASDLSTVNGKATVVIQLGRDYVSASNFVEEDGVLKFKTVLDNQVKNITTLSGSAIVMTRYENVVTKIKEGVYSAYLFIGDGTSAAYKKSLPIRVEDSQPKVNFNWTKYSTSLTVLNEKDVAGVLAVVKDCIAFTYPDAWTDVTRGIYINEGDYILKGTSLQIDKVRYLIPIEDQVFEQIININRPVRIGVTDC